MPQQRFHLDRRTLDEAAASAPVRTALRDKAARILPRAQRLAAAAGARAFAASLRVEEGRRPGIRSPKRIRRPYARVIATSADATAVEHGDVSVSKQAILRRAMGA